MCEREISEKDGEYKQLSCVSSWLTLIIIALKSRRVAAVAPPKDPASGGTPDSKSDQQQQGHPPVTSAQGASTATVAVDFTAQITNPQDQPSAEGSGEE